METAGLWIYFEGKHKRFFADALVGGLEESKELKTTLRFGAE